MKLLVLPTLMTALTYTVLASFTTQVNARPRDTIKRNTPNTQISVNIVKGDTRVDNIPCTQIYVTLKEFIPTKPEPNKFSIPKERDVSQGSLFKGNNLSEGCSYNLGFNYIPKIGAYGASSFQISAQAGRIVSTQAVSDPFPNNINIQLFPPPPVPR
jgi:hypothetical protein